MIIKSLSRHNNVDQLIRYVLRDEKLQPPKEQTRKSYYIPIKLSQLDLKYLESERVDKQIMKEWKEFKGTLKEFIERQRQVSHVPGKEKGIVKSNVRARSINGYIREFAENEKFRLHERKDSVRAIHTILSFNSLDSKALTDFVLRDIANHYISLKPEAQIIAAFHRDRSHVHIHFVENGVLYKTGISNRVTKQQFYEIKKSMQEYVKDRHPKIVHSFPRHGMGKNFEKGVQKSYKIDERTNLKSTLLGCIETVVKTAKTPEHLIELLKENNYAVYSRNDKMTGIVADGLKFRFSRLGVDIDTALKELEAKQENTLKEIKNLRNRGKEINKTKSAPPLGTAGTEKAATDFNEKDKVTQLHSLINQHRALNKEHTDMPESGLFCKTEKPAMEELEAIRQSKSKERDANAGRDTDDRDTGLDDDSAADNEEDNDIGNENETSDDDGDDEPDNFSGDECDDDTDNGDR